MTSRASRCRRRAARPAFTLVELLLVLAIIAVVSAVTVPSLARSMRGNRLRTAVRSVVSAGRYARSMAVLRQEDMVLTFDFARARLVVEQIRLAAAPPPAEGTRDDAAAAAAEPEPGSGEVIYTVDSRREELARVLEGVQIESVEVEGVVCAAGTCPIVYGSNGRCTPYTVIVRDERGERVRIDVDPLASAETEKL